MGWTRGWTADPLRLNGDHSMQIGLEGAEHLQELLQIQQLVAFDLFGGGIDLDARNAYRALPEDAAVGTLLDGEDQLFAVGVKTFAGSVVGGENRYNLVE